MHDACMVIDITEAASDEAKGEAVPAAGRAADPAIVELCEAINRVVCPVEATLPVAV